MSYLYQNCFNRFEIDIKGGIQVKSISELFAERSDSKWPTGGHFELLEMRGDLKQALLIFKDVNANDHFMIHNESRHPQLHADHF